MARIEGKFIRGLAGAVIFKEHRGQQVAQGKSKKRFIAMTPASYDAAYVFGKASTLAQYIRQGIGNLISFYDGGMPSRFTGECNQILQKAATAKGASFQFAPDAFSRLNGFEFNTASPVRNLLFIQPVVEATEQKIYIDVPEINLPSDLRYASKVYNCILGFRVALFDLEHHKFTKQEVQTLEMKYENKVDIIPSKKFEFDSAPGCLYVVALGLYFYEKTFAGNVVLNSKSFSPAAVLKAGFTPAEPNAEETKAWHDITYSSKKKHKSTGAKKKKDAKPD